MNKIFSITLVLSLTIMSFIFMVFNFLATHDIHNDYVSKKVVASGVLGNIGELPEWTDCNLEWHVVDADLLIRFLYMLFISVFLIILINKNYRQLKQS